MKYKFILFCIILSTKICCQEVNENYETAVVQFMDSFISFIQEDNYYQAYKLTDELSDENVMTFDEFVKYFKAIKHFYGHILDFQIELRSISIKNETDNNIHGLGSIEFENVKGKLIWTLKKRKSDILKLAFFEIFINENIQVENLNNLATNALEFIRLGDFDGLYYSTKLYKRYKSIDKYNEKIKKIFIDESFEYKLKRQDIRVSNNRIYISLDYEVNKQGDMFILEYLDENDSTYLYDLHFFFNNENKKYNSELFKTSIYENEKYNFSCEYPSDWEILNTTGYVVIFSEPKKEDDVFNTTFDIQAIESTNINEFCKNYEKSISESTMFEEFEIISKSETEFIGLMAIEYHCFAKISYFIPVNWKSIFFLHDKYLFILTTTSLIGKDFLYRYKTEKIFETFRFN